MADRSAAASATLRAMGPAVSWLDEMGTMPLRLTKPMVGLMPTTAFMVDGLTMDPDVSVPTANGQKPAETATPEPELEPPGVRSSA